MRMLPGKALQFHDLDTAGYLVAFDKAELADMVLAITENSIDVRPMVQSDKEIIRDKSFSFSG